MSSKPEALALGAVSRQWTSTRVALVSCSARKLDHAAPARELYTGDLFRLSMAWLEARDHVYPNVGILSAKHGLVMPDDEIEPYDQPVADFGTDERKAWERLVHEQLMGRWGAGRIYTVLAGADYRRALRWLPMVEDVFGHWCADRRDRGDGKAGIGFLKRELKRNRGFY